MDLSVLLSVLKPVKNLRQIREEFLILGVKGSLHSYAGSDFIKSLGTGKKSDADILRVASDCFGSLGGFTLHCDTPVKGWFMCEYKNGKKPQVFVQQFYEGKIIWLCMLRGKILAQFIRDLYNIK